MHLYMQYYLDQPATFRNCSRRQSELKVVNCFKAKIKVILQRKTNVLQSSTQLRPSTREKNGLRHSHTHKKGKAKKRNFIQVFSRPNAEALIGNTVN